MNKLVLEFTPSQVEQLVEKLPLEEKIRLVRKLEGETWANKLDMVTQKMRRRIRKTKVSGKEIERICEEVKREYDDKHRNH